MNREVISLKLREIPLTLPSVIFLISVLIFGGCGGGGGESSGGAGTISLAWDAPATNSDGSPLADLAGYYVYYGTASRVYGAPIDAKNVTGYTLTGLTHGQTYFIAVTAYDTSQNESQFSDEVSGVAK